MQGIENITSRIQADAQAEIDKILADARTQAADIAARYEAQAQKEALSSRVAEQQQINDQLQAGIDNGGSEEEMKKIAREELDLVDPNEKIFYDTSN